MRKKTDMTKEPTEIMTEPHVKETPMREKDCYDCSHFPVCHYYYRTQCPDLYNICKYKDFGTEILRKNTNRE